MSVEFEKYYPDVNWSGVMTFCKKCKAPVVSIYMEKPYFEHDFQKCPCGECGLDNGGEYLRCIGHVENILNVKKDSVFSVIVNDVEHIAFGYNSLKNLLMSLKDLDWTDMVINVVSED